MWSMYGIFTNIGSTNHPNVGKYTIHGAYGYSNCGYIYIICTHIVGYVLDIDIYINTVTYIII